MFQYLYDWMINAAFYLVIFTAVIQLLPNGTYHKYVRFFTGLILIVLILSPAFKVLGMEHSFQDLYGSLQYEQEKEEIEQSSEFLKETDIFDFLPEEYPSSEDEESGGNLEDEGGLEDGENLREEETSSQENQENPEGDIHVEEIQIGE